LKFAFGVGVLLGKGGGNVGTKTGRLSAARMLASFPFKAGSIDNKAKGPNGRSVSCLHAIEPKSMMIKVISRGLIRCLDQSSEEGTEGAACGIGAHLKRPIPMHTQITHCKPGPDATFADKW